MTRAARTVQGAFRRLLVIKTAAARTIQAVVRGYLVDKLRVPQAKRAAEETWLLTRKSDLERRKQGSLRHHSKVVARLFMALPRQAEPSKFKLEPSKFKLNGVVPKPDQAKLAELLHELQETIGLQVVKRWIFKLVEDALRFHAAGKPITIRHLLMSGGLGRAGRLRRS